MHCFHGVWCLFRESDTCKCWCWVVEVDVICAKSVTLPLPLHHRLVQIDTSYKLWTVFSNIHTGKNAFSKVALLQNHLADVNSFGPRLDRC